MTAAPPLLDPPPRPGAAAALHALLGGFARLDALLLAATGDAPAEAPPTDRAEPAGALAGVVRGHGLDALDAHGGLPAPPPGARPPHAPRDAPFQGGAR